MTTEEILLLQRTTIYELYYHMRFIFIDTKTNMNTIDQLSFMMSNARPANNAADIHSLLQQTAAFDNGIENFSKDEHFVIKSRLSEQVLGTNTKKKLVLCITC